MPAPHAKRSGQQSAPHMQAAPVTTPSTAPHARHAVHVRGGLIAGVAAGAPGTDRHTPAKRLLAGRPLPLLDFGDAVVAPGLVDLHVHMNEPGREEWEGALG